MFRIGRFITVASFLATTAIAEPTNCLSCMINAQEPTPSGRGQSHQRNMGAGSSAVNRTNPLQRTLMDRRGREYTVPQTVQRQPTREVPPQPAAPVTPQADTQFAYSNVVISSTAPRTESTNSFSNDVFQLSPSNYKDYPVLKTPAREISSLKFEDALNDLAPESDFAGSETAMKLASLTTGLPKAAEVMVSPEELAVPVFETPLEQTSDRSSKLVSEGAFNAPEDILSDKDAEVSDEELLASGKTIKRGKNKSKVTGRPKGLAVALAPTKKSPVRSAVRQFADEILQ